MPDDTELVKDEDFINALIESLPCGFLVIDREGCVKAVNNVMEHVFGISHRTVIGQGFGHTLSCLHAVKESDGCGSAGFCDYCEVREFARTALESNQKQKARTNLELIIQGQVRDVTLLLTAVPFSYKNTLFCILIVEDITKVGSLCPPNTVNGFWGIVSQDAKMLELFEMIKQIARTDAPVLVQGESGTGKELVALAIHKESLRARKHFVAVNCGALPEGLLESELFGHVKGAFTGALHHKKGRFELADGGSIFLDEVSELSQSMQAKFLRVLQDGCFERVGDEKTIRVNVRVISATNSDLEREVAAGRFRQDLYYRLCVIPVSIPPLRERRGDISLLADHFVTQFSENAWRQKLTLSPSALSTLISYTWPGNVRELQNALQFAMAKCQGQVIEPRDLPPRLLLSKSMSSVVRRRGSRIQENRVAEALREARGNKSLAAKILGVSRSTLYRFLAGQHTSPYDH